MHHWLYHYLLIILIGVFAKTLFYNQVCHQTTSEDLGEPLVLLKIDRNGAYKVQENVIRRMFDFLPNEILKRKLAVISITGGYRQGKSFLHNLMLRFLQHNGSEGWMDNCACCDLKGFLWRGGPDRVTDGITAWSRPFLVGNDLAVVLLDTEGMHNERSTHEFMSLIFTITAQLSSVQIYNIHQRLNKNDLNDIKFFLDYAKVIKSLESKYPFQQLKFVVRDWSHFEKYQYGEDGGKKLLQNWEKEDKEGIFDTIEDAYIEDVSCFLMPYPGDEVAKNSKYRGRTDALDGSFKYHTKKFIENILSPSKLKARKIGDQYLRVEQFPQQFKMIVEALKNSKFKPVTAHQLQVDESCRIAREKSYLKYKESILKNQYETKYLENLIVSHVRAEEIAQNYFESCVIFGEKGRDECRRKLLEDIANEFKNAVIHFSPHRDYDWNGIIKTAFDVMATAFNPKTLVRSIVNIIYGTEVKLLN